jgi:hypothetical protein
VADYRCDGSFALKKATAAALNSRLNAARSKPEVDAVLSMRVTALPHATGRRRKA